MKLTIGGCFLFVLSGILVDTTSMTGTAASLTIIGVVLLKYLEGSK